MDYALMISDDVDGSNYVILGMVDVNDLDFLFFQMSIFLDTTKCLRTPLGNYMAATRGHRTQ